ncbi:hypothetical protein JAAARDRAFT_528315 [Jaapia argillacea MUCL 33604]|uniref:F-box domain-containing protein n=1 Tax=Jaapia argillacea MUCL 33604 TaxID=933084 RepID=A0A067Q4K1_9AGAM|nr:hypothetical protein JAAARDRAFT_528315 [Jaapia argillacea MUCL 33604]
MTDIGSAILESLRSNIFVAPEVFFRQELSKAEQEVADLEAEISALQSQIRVLQNKKPRVQPRCANIKSLFAPIRRLLPEVLSEIFKHLVIPDSRNLRNFRDYSLPLRLTHICSYWRWLAISMPTLWSRISLWPADEFQLQLYQPTLDLFLCRSAALLISFSVAFPDAPEDETLLDNLVDHAFRWKDICIHMGVSEDPLRPLLRIREASLTQLECLELLSDEDLSPDNFPFLRDITCFEDAPMLTHVTLGRFWYPDSLARPWSQLTHLALGSQVEPICVPLHEFFETLRKCSELTHLDIVYEDNGDDDGEQASPQDSITLGNLQSLFLMSVDRDDTLLQRLIAPQLAHISYEPHCLRLPTNSFVSSLAPLQTCITRSRCTITTLALSPTDTPSQDMFGWLDTLPSLREVTIDAAERVREYQEAIINYFLPCGNGTSFDCVAGDYKIPMLQRIIIKGLVNSPFIVESLVSMIRFRCGFGSSTDLPARLVFAAFSEDLCTVLKTRLEDCIAAGLHLGFCE